MDNGENSKFFKFMNAHLMGPMGKLASFRIVRAVMAAGMASIPFTIVGSMVLIISVLPQSFSVLQGFWSVSFDRINDLYMLANTATMGVLALYFCIVFGFEYTRIQQSEEQVDVNPINGALLGLLAFMMCVPELMMKNGAMKLVNVNNKTQTILAGWEMNNGVTRIGTTGIFTAIIMSILAVKIYTACVKHNVTIKLPAAVPTGVANAFTALIPAALIAFVVMVINGLLVALNTDIFKVIAVPFSFVTNLTNTWIGIMVIYFVMHALWIVGIHGATIVTSFLTPIVLSNMVANTKGANIPFAGEFNNCFVTVGGSGATLGMCIFIAFFAKSEQLGAIGKAALVPSFFNINEPLIFGLPIVYNPYVAVPFFLAPMTSASVAYFAIKFHMVKPPIIQVPWPTPVGMSGFIGNGNDWRAAVLGIVCALAAFIIWFPFIKMYDNKLHADENAKAAELAKAA
ncbi:PTS cellobiose transporter subunit IIC [Schleiferilactobacillus perolens]|jgi:PTS system cellobiose-specific IIC component|uniref:PTS cellobiose transporter subunit IIC n=1 Tax=Schleiferilactobacillus perolens TaxID=100468 RepID=UPI002356A795|nr:PTS cellobiose transporter subunit IIC [Schleiferilactobacillus perolens]MCI1891778.1 PTS cellobiose transporter subunit IIC [Schleiferilactobacillus harbinensis]MCI1912619.1 PTS cellobiose transporter subunit IIC [Schleiferilactobacillus harbinensis]MCI2171413.1 PTS cellobiose transporter subunit IIC [Schleiferilactobacillus perolens]